MSGTMLEIGGLVKRFDGVKALSDFSCSVKASEILGLIGPNGAGKTTLFNVLSGFVKVHCTEKGHDIHVKQGLPDSFSQWASRPGSHQAGTVTLLAIIRLSSVILSGSNASIVQCQPQ